MNHDEFRGPNPNDEELSKECIERRVWDDPELWDDKEYALFWRLEYERLTKTETQARMFFANDLQVPGTWDCIIEAYKKIKEKTVSASSTV